MLAQRGRAKKLTVAFHFYLRSQAGWRCDECRKNGLEEERGCGWKGALESARVVWMGGGAAVSRCPTWEVSGQSTGWLEEFAAWKTIGGVNLYELPAKTADAFCVLENLVRAEREHESG